MSGEDATSYRVLELLLLGGSTLFRLGPFERERGICQGRMTWSVCRIWYAILMTSGDLGTASRPPKKKLCVKGRVDARLEELKLARTCTSVV